MAKASYITEEGLAKLKKELEQADAQQESLHFALDVLKNTGDDAKGAMEAFKPLSEKAKQSDYVRRISKHLVEKFSE